MPGKVKVKIIAGRNLPVMDRASDTTDAYVEIKLGTTTYKTDVCRKSLNPQWNSDWYRFEIDDSELQDEPLQIRLMDHDTYSANDAIGKVYLDLNPLLLPAAGLLSKYGWNNDSNANQNSNAVMSGWIPVYDTMHGIRGEVNVTVKVELFSDFNKFRQSSCGVPFFCSPVIPQGFHAKEIHGFVEELIVNDDPEYQWIDKIRTPRASNEARQTLFFKLSGELQRKIGVKALDLGGNAVIGYSQCFDLEGESGIVARGIGTAVTLMKLQEPSYNTPNSADTAIDDRVSSYLKFISADNFRLNRDPDIYNKTMSLIVQPPQSPTVSTSSFNSLYEESTTGREKRKHVHKKKRIFTRHLSHDDFNPVQLPSRHDSHDSLQFLLLQEDLRGTKNGLSQKIRNLKYSSQNMLSKKMGALRARLSDSGMLEEDDSDSKSIKSLVTDVSKLRYGYLCKRSKSSSSCMAELLVRSVMQAHNSLDCISEHHDSEDTSEKNPLKESKDHPVSKRMVKTRSEPYLAAPSTSSRLSNASSTSVESSSSSSDDNVKETKEELETISLIVKNVEKEIQRRASLEDHNLEHEKSDFLKEDNEIEQKDVEKGANCPPLAKTEDFEVESTEEESFSSTSSEISSKEDTSISLADTSQYIPHITVEPHLEKQSLVGTAMQTMLIEKLNIIGSYFGESEHGSIPRHHMSEMNLEHKDESEVIEHKEKSEVKEHEEESEAKQQHEESKPEERQEGMNSILPQVIVDTEVEHQSLVGAAIQTMLLEKLNIVGSYFPSAEKSLETKEQSKQPPEKKTKTKKSRGSGNNLSFFPQIAKTFESMKKSSIKLVPNPSSQTPNVSANANNFTLTPTIESYPNDVPVQIGPDCVSVHNSSINKQHVASLNPSNRPFGSYIPERVVSPRESGEVGHQRTESVGGKSSYSPARLYMTPCIHRRSSDSDLSITPKGNSLSDYARPNTILRPTMHQENFDIMEYPFLTMSKYPPGFITHLGGAVSARSVKLLERITNIEEPESRDTWWSELRMEIRSHAKALNCNAVLGYSESASICEDVCVLSATGAAAVIGLHYNGDLIDNVSNMPIIAKNSKDLMASSLDKKDFQMDRDKQTITSPVHVAVHSKIEENLELAPSPICAICHIPYNESNVPFRITLSKCGVCKTVKVPDVLLTTIEIPEGAPVTGRGCFLQAYVCRPKRDLRGELNAKEISDGLPFLEYELHRLLVNKLKVKGMNAVFGLNVRISIGERLMIGIATGTAVFLLPLPPPPMPILVSDGTTDDKKLAEMQTILLETVKKNKEIYQLKTDTDITNMRIFSESEELPENDQVPIADLESRDSCVLEIDDAEDIEGLNLLMEPRPPEGFHVVNTELIPGLDDLEIVRNLQMFTQIWRAKIPLNQPSANVGKHFHRLLQSVYFKLRSMIPCALCDLKFRVDLPEQDEIQLCVLGMALGLSGPSTRSRKKDTAKKTDDDLIFNLDEDQTITTTAMVGNANSLHVQQLKQRQKSPQRFRNKPMNIPIRERLGVDITPLSYIPGGRIERYLGNLNFFFIRETTSIREGGGFSGFIHSFVTEVLAIVRAHITALGGNAMVAYFLTECVLYQNPHKNQGQCLINVGGDVVQVTYFSD